MPTIASAPAPGTQPRLGRIPAPDIRDQNYSMSAPTSNRTFRNWESPDPIWDQGNTSQCVSYAVNRFLVAYRIINQPPMSFGDFYHECQLVDEWPGEAYDGTSVRAGFKVLKTLGYVSSYSWAQDISQIINQMLEVGPVVVGVDWTDHMFTPDTDGYIWPQGKIAGGHAFLLTRINLTRNNPDGTTGAIRMINSWGPSWGLNGYAWLTLSTVEKLLKGLTSFPGEAATAQEILKTT